MPIAHLGHAELLVNDIEASTRFFTEVFGLWVTEQRDGRVYLRAWQDWDHHTLVLTEAPESGLGHIAWRVDSPGALQEAERQLERLNVPSRWIEGGVGHGDALRFQTPSGLPMELYWEVERFVAGDPALRSKLPSHPQKYIPRGLTPRRFDHVNCMVDDVLAEQEWLTRELGIRHNYYLTSGGGQRLASWLAKTNLSHEIALMRNRNQSGSMLHHVGYYVDSPDQLVRAATVLAENDIKIEWGPGAHGTSGAMFLYAFEPSGHRVEVWTGGFLLFAPDWEPIRWDPETSPLGLEMWGSAMPDSYLTYGTPVAAPLGVA